jgi:hypothetical protein
VQIVYQWEGPRQIMKGSFQCKSMLRISNG